MRVHYSARAGVNRSGLIVGGTRKIGYNRNGKMKFRRQQGHYLRPDARGGKFNPYYVHTTWTVKAGSTLNFAAATANGPQLASAGPIVSCTAQFK
jgi:hypothetical protein